MQTEARDLGAEWGRAGLDGLEVNSIAEALETSSGARAGGGAAADRRARDFGQERCVARDGICVCRLCVEQTPAREQSPEAARHAARNPCDFGVVGRCKRDEAHRAGAWIRVVHTVEHERVEVQIQVQGVPEALHEADRPALEPPLAPADPGARAAAKSGEHRAQKHAEHVARELAVVGQPVAQLERKRQHPLAHRDLGQHLVDQVCGGLGHAPPPAGGTEPSTLAGERHEPFVPAVRAAHAQEAVAREPAFQIGAKLALDEARDGPVAFARVREEGLEFGTQCAMQHPGLGRAR